MALNTGIQNRIVSAERPRIRVRVTTTYEVDAEAWAAEWSLPADDRSVRKDVKGYFGNDVPGHLDHIVRMVEFS